MTSLLENNETSRLGTLPEPDNLTLLFKFARHTTLLSVAPSQHFDEIKELLLSALRSRAIDKIGDYDVPKDKDELELGVLIDRKDAKKGWMLLSERDRDDPDRSPVNKKKKKSTTTDSEATPEAYGLADGTWIAVRVKTPNLIPSVEKDGLDEVEDADDDPGWDVVLPQLDDDDEEQT